MNITAALERLAEVSFAVQLECNPHRTEHTSVADFMERYDRQSDMVGHVDPSRDLLYELFVYTSSCGHYVWTGQDLGAVIGAALAHFNITPEKP